MLQSRLLITGVCGFTGRHLVARLRRDCPTTIVGVDTAENPEAEVDRYMRCDLTDRDAVIGAVQAARPEFVFHLAGLYGRASPQEVWKVNVGGFVHMRDALRVHAAKSDQPVRVLTVGSAAEIGTVRADELPVDEQAHCAPESAYGRSKLEVTHLALAEPPAGPVQFVVARAFNLVGPGLDRRLALGNLAHQVAAAGRGECDRVCCGPLDTRRDFVDVRDAVEAYIALVKRGRAGQIYNVCAGRPYLIGDLLRLMIHIANNPIPVDVDPSRKGGGDVPEIYGDHTKITRQLGWRPTVPIEQSLTDLLAAA